MVTLYKAKSVDSGARGVLSALRKRQGRSIIIVPDAFTLSLETGIFTESDRQGTFDVEVMSFARLAAVALGKDLAKCLSPAGCVMLMEKVVRKYEPSLRAYGKVAKKPGFASEIYAAITAIRNSGIDVERLSAAVDGLSGYVKEKTADIVTLYKGYLEELSLSHTDSTTRLEALASAICSRELLTDVDFYVLDHFEFNAKQLEVLSALMAHARSVSIAVVEHDGSENRRIYPSSTYHKLLAAARKAGVSVREVTLDNDLTAEKKLIADKLFSYAYQEGTTSSIHLTEAKDPEEEVTLLATEIVRLVRKEGIRYRDVAVITPSFEAYLPYVERIFSYYDIPFFADARYPLSECDVFLHLLKAFDLVTRNFDSVSVSEYVSHELFISTDEEKELFDDYVTAYGVDRSAFLRPFHTDKEEWAAAEAVRTRLTDELSEFLSAGSKATVREYAEIFRAFLKRNDFDEKIASYAERIHAAGHLKSSNVIGQSSEKIINLLSAVEEIRGEETVTREEFIFVLRSGAEQVKIAALPVSLDCVYFAPVEQAMYAPIDSLFLLGAEDGLFPLETVKEGILGMREYIEWQKLDIVIENTGVEELGRSRFHALQLLLRPTRLFLSYTRMPSSSIKELKMMFSLPIKKASERFASEYTLDDLIPTTAVAKNYLMEYSRKERESLLSDRERNIATSIASALGETFPLPSFEEVPERVLTKCFFRSGESHVSQIETYYKCPFLHFVQYGLGLKERDVAYSDARDFGNVIHECVCDFTKNRKNLQLDDVSAEKRAKEITDHVLSKPEYQVLAETEGKHLLGRFAAAAVASILLVRRQILSSKFVPSYFEASFGSNGVFPSFDLGEIRLKGKIDRVDLLDKYVSVIDYKTGTANISPSDVYYGKKIQLQIYLAVLREMGYLPAASFYFDLSGKKRKEKTEYLKGQMLAEPYIVYQMDEKSVSEKSEFTGIGRKNETEIGMKKDVTVSSKEMESMIDYAILLAKQAIRDISEGCIIPSPIGSEWKSSCSWCKAKSICHFANRYLRKENDSVHVEDLVRILVSEEEKCD